MKARLRQARLLPLGVLARKVGASVVSRVLTWGRARRDARAGTYLQGERVFVPLQLPKVEPSEAEATLLLLLAERFAAHEFDLLGSGWVRVPSPGCDPGPHGCRAESARIRSLIEGPYEPIDWHLDFKSGYRWSALTWYLNVPYGHLPGVDVKVPWELARLQHVPVLLLAARVAEPGEAARWRSEAVNQMLDFVAANPPRFGVNWRTAMDVGIRAANMALAMDLLAQDRIEGPWRGLLTRSLEEHARHIVENLEWSPRARGNHYLANIAGLAWCASHLPESDQTDAWLVWCAQELRVELDRQFLPDGANFEASVCYHRLSAEIVSWTSACLASVPIERWKRAEQAPRALAPSRPELVRAREPDWKHLRESLASMETFTRWMTKHDGRVAQFGDNDSGRYFRLPGYAAGDEGVPFEASLDHGETLDVLQALRGAPAETVAGQLAAALARWSGEVTVPVPAPTCPRLQPEVPNSGADAQGTSVWSLGEGCWDGLETGAFPDFGVYVWRSKRVWMAVRCGSVGQGGLGGHAHCDALAVELQVDGVDWIADPGTAAYTSDPATRNRYRSVRAHFCPQANGREPSPLDRGVFRLPGYGARCLAFGPEGFEGVHTGYGGEVKRRVSLRPDGFMMLDTWDRGELGVLPHPDSESPWRAVPFSSGYGSVGP